MKEEKFSLRKRFKSLGYAFNGLKLLLKMEHNSRIHLVAAVVAILLGWELKISVFEWMVLVLVISAVFVAELFNSALENLADHLSPGRSEPIKRVKDLAAAAVLVCAFSSVVIAILIFLPKVLQLFR